jgi:hypothetical protein
VSNAYGNSSLPSWLYIGGNSSPLIPTSLISQPTLNKAADIVNQAVSGSPGIILKATEPSKNNNQSNKGDE